MFTLKTLLGCVHVQLLTYKAAFLKNSLSWPTCLHVLYEPMSVCSFEHNFPLLRLMWHVSTSCINCETWQCAIFTKKRFSALFWLTRCKFSHTKSFQRSLVWPTRRTVICIHCEKNVPLCNFLTYEVMPMRNFKHITPCLSHNFPPMYLKRNTTTRLLNLRTLLCMQLLTYETLFEYIVWPIRRTARRVHCKKNNFTQRFVLQGHARVQNSHTRTCLCVVCRHLISICFMTSVVFPRKYLDSVMFMHKFTHYKTCLFALFVSWRCVRVQFDT